MSTLDLQTMLSQASALRAAGKFSQAEAAYLSVLKASPVLPDAWFNLAWVQRQLGKYESALDAYQNALDLEVSTPEEALVNRGVIFADGLLRPDAAQKEFETAIERNAHYEPALFNLANLREDYGDRDGARTLYERILKRNADAWPALARLGGLADPNDAAMMKRLTTALERPDLSAQAKAQLGFSVARMLDAAGQYKKAFEVAERANRDSKVGAPAYDRAAAEARVDAILAVAAARPRPRGPVTPSPIFISGMFRSGSTLIEQVIGGHPNVTVGGELNLLESLVSASSRAIARGSVAARTDDGSQMAAAYVGDLKRRFPTARFVTDKRPDSYYFIGLMKQMFPDAKIIHPTRDPLDTIISIYMLQLDPSVTYANDLMNIAHHYVQHERLMNHWRARYPNDIIDINYDAFVRDPKPQAMKMAQVLGLDWREDMLAFQKRSNAVKSASNMQVREELYTRSSGRWKNYEAQLKDVKAYLQQARVI